MQEHHKYLIVKKKKNQLNKIIKTSKLKVSVKN